ncbi:hypothetical protein GW17_00057336 [Ensete ventricosum]|nr:hypothetical protein GW17_00057336 [Ensete ventricosum]
MTALLDDLSSTYRRTTANSPDFMFLLPKHTNLCLPIIALIVGPVDPAHLHLVCTLYTSNDSYSSLSILGAWR